MADYLAIIYIGGGSSHGRSPDKEKAITNALRYFRDWEDVFVLPEQDVQIAVWNVDGYDQVVWGPHGLDGIREDTGAEEKIQGNPEIVTRHFIPRKRKRA